MSQKPHFLANDLLLLPGAEAGNELWNPGRELLMVPGRQGMKNHHSPLNGFAENAARAWDSFVRHISPRIEENL